MAQSSQKTSSTSGKIKVLGSCTLGTALEFYDFALYGAIASNLSHLFFPADNPLISLILSYGVFAISFIARPLGSIVFGKIGDKFGRKKAFGLSILYMSLPTVLIGCLPVYDSIGVMAPLLLILLRLMQGICTGGEFNGAYIYALEHYPNRGGFTGSIISTSVVFGMLLALIAVTIINKPGMPEWAWRIPFLFGGVIGFFGYYIRNKLGETPEFQECMKEVSAKKETQTGFSKSYDKILLTFAIGAVTGCLFYTQFVLMSAPFPLWGLFFMG